MAGERASNGEEEQGEGRTSFAVSGTHGCPHFALRSCVLLSECGELRSCVFLANNHKKLWRERYPDRIPGRFAFCLRGHRHGVARSALRPHHGTKGTRRCSTADGSGWDRIVRTDIQSHHCHGAALLCADRRLLGATDVLAVAGELLDRSIGRG